ncbi:hypothetical protein ACFT1A_26610 [Rhodococcus sp. NPDC057135]
MVRLNDQDSYRESKSWLISRQGVKARQEFITLGMISIILLYAGVGFIALTVSTYNSNSAISYYLGISEPFGLTIGVLVFLVGFFIMFWAVARRNNARAGFYEEAESRALGAADRAVDDIKGPDDLIGLMRANRKQMEAYDALARSQAASAHFASMVAGGIGLLTITSGILVIVFAGDSSTKYAAALIAAAGAATSGYVAKTFIYVQDGTMQQMRFYFQQPLVQSYLLSAERLIAQLPEKQRGKQLEHVISAMVAQAHGNSIGHSPAIDLLPVSASDGESPTRVQKERSRTWRRSRS